MSVFTYIATDARGRTVTGEFDAPDKKSVVIKLQNENCFPISVEAENKKRRTFPLSGFSFTRKALSQREILDLTSQTATLLKSGMELDRCFGILAELTQKEKSREVIKSIQEAIHGGETLSGAMAKQEGLFSSLYLSMVKAGEAGGFLEKAFDRLAYYLENRLKLIESIRSAMIYPAVLFTAGAGALAVLAGYVIPKFAVIFEGMGAELPSATLFLVWVSSFVVENYLWLLTTAVLLTAAVNWIIRIDAVRRRWDGIVLKLPLFGSLIQKSVVAQFTRTLGTLLQSGVPIIQSLKIVKETISNKVIADMVSRTTQGVKEGKKMSDIIKESGLFPPLATHMMLVGEESGKLDEMMIRMADIYDGEVETAVKRMITLLEPVMILVMGLAVAFVVVSMLTAIFSVNDLPL